MSDQQRDQWWVYVIQSEERGCTYVGASNDPTRRLRQHRGDIEGGAKFTKGYDDWTPLALYGPYSGRSGAQSVEHRVKQKTGENRAQWFSEDMKVGKGSDHPWVDDPTGWGD